MGDIVETRQNELKTKQICRFCLSRNSSELTNIYTKSNDNPKTAPLPMQVMACVSIEVFSSDCMPALVCNDCRLIFDYCYRFKQMCKKADTYLRHYPLTGMWATPIDHPTIPPELYQKQKVSHKILNSPPTSNPIEVPEPRKEEKKRPIEKPLVLRQVKHKAPQKIEIEIEEPVEEEKSQPLPPPAPRPKPAQVERKQQGVKILNKSAIRILNKEAQKIIEPIIAKPVLKRDNDGNMAVVTQILEQDLPEVKGTEVLDTNVYPCPHCERSFPLQQLLDIHMVNHNRERSFNCEYCDKSFFSKYDLQKHNLTHTGEKPFKCVICDKGFTRSTLLHRHEKTHIDIPKFICVFCEKPFISQEEMEKHTERHRKNRPYACRICNKAFAFKQGLERHEVVHCRQQPFQCQYCDQSFPTPSKLARHLTAHAGSRPYPCKLCSKSYLLSHHLSRHMRSHKNSTGLYKCNDCNKSFNNRDDLIYHSAVHAAQTKVCPLCKDAFEDIETVTEHVRQHAEGEAYACEFCDLIYMTSVRLDDHIKDVHADEMVAYNEDDKKNELAAKKAEKQGITEVEVTREIDDEIEEFLYEEYPEDNTLKKEPTEESAVVKEEQEWKTQLKDAVNASVEDSELMDDDTLELMNIIEESMSETADEPPAKVQKIDDKSQKTTQIVSIKPVPQMRRKPAAKPAQAMPPPASASSSSSSPKENKKPSPPMKIISGLKQVSVKPITTKTRQPTIQDALRAIPQSVSIKKIETPKKPVEETPKPVEVEKTGRKSSPRVAAAATAQPNKATNKQSPTNTRTLRQRGETTPEAKTTPKASPVSSTTTNKKSPQKSVLAEAKKIEEPVEMMIGNKKVKVKKVTMSKAQVAEMTRDGRIQMKGGTMILKKSREDAEFILP